MALQPQAPTVRRLTALQPQAPTVGFSACPLGPCNPPPLVCDAANASLMDLDWTGSCLPSCDLPAPCRVRHPSPPPFLPFTLTPETHGADATYLAQALPRLEAPEASCDAWCESVQRLVLCWAQELYAVLSHPRIDLDCPRALEGSLSDAIAWSLRTPGALLQRTIQVIGWPCQSSSRY